MNATGIDTQTPFRTAAGWFFKLDGRLKVSVVKTTMALFEDGKVLRPRQLDMGNSRLNAYNESVID